MRVLFSYVHAVIVVCIKDQLFYLTKIGTLKVDFVLSYKLFQVLIIIFTFVKLVIKRF